jgi:predicted O-linked N-acetylglucosamine transferase (SPINDLY family)
MTEPQQTVGQLIQQAIPLHQTGHLDEAAVLYRQALIADPNCCDALNLLGVLARQQNRHADAIDFIRRAIAIQPGIPDYHFNLGEAHRALGQNNEAIAAYQEALRGNPNDAEIRHALGQALESARRFGEAADAYRASLSMEPTKADRIGHLGNALSLQGQHEEAIATYRQALQLNPNQPAVHSNLLMTLNYPAGLDPKQVFAEHVAWARQHAAPFASHITAHYPDRTPGRRLRIGYVSPDFRNHSVAHFFRPLLAAHNRERFELYAYANVSRPDEVTNALRARFHHWRDIAPLSDDQAAQLIRSDGIDILVDLAGHTGDNRLLLFARKPAPIQVTYLGYPNTTGLSTIDARFSDANADPPGLTDSLHTEKLIRLPDCFLCYGAPTNAPHVAPAPSMSNPNPRRITFASFNNLSKLSAAVVESWSQILRAVPDSRLLLKTAALADAAIQQRTRERFAQHGIAPDRLELLGATLPFFDHLRCYDRVDIALDTFPYNGTTTTCEALWMGVPVIALAGNTHASRVGVSLFSAVGLTDLIAPTADAYVHLATTLAASPQRLHAMRSALRPHVAASPLVNPQRLVRAMESAYLQMWQQLPTDPFAPIASTPQQPRPRSPFAG